MNGRFFLIVFLFFVIYYHYLHLFVLSVTRFCISLLLLCLKIQMAFNKRIDAIDFDHIHDQILVQWKPVNSCFQFDMLPNRDDSCLRDRWVVLQQNHDCSITITNVIAFCSRFDGMFYVGESCVRLWFWLKIRVNILFSLTLSSKRISVILKLCWRLLLLIQSFATMAHSREIYGEQPPTENGTMKTTKKSWTNEFGNSWNEDLRKCVCVSV